MVEEGKTLSSLPIPTKTSGDTVFQGWYTKNGTDNDWGTPFTVLTSIITDITVYAKWGSVAPTKYTITFNPDGGTVDPASIQVNSGDPAGSLPIPKKNNNTFEGWWTMQNGGGTQFIETTTVDVDITVYAKWTVIIATNQKKISITGLSDYDGKRIQVILTETQNPTNSDDLIANYFDSSGPLIINGEREELPLYAGSGQSQPWIGSGSYYVEIIIRATGTNHKDADYISKNKIAFISTTTIVEFSLDDFNVQD
jgi:hypothetical protein